MGYVRRPSGNVSVQWLSEEALRRYERLRPATYTERPQVVAELRKTRGGAILDLQDLVSDVLDDNDFVSVGRSGGKVASVYYYWVRVYNDNGMS